MLGLHKNMTPLDTVLSLSESIGLTTVDGGASFFEDNMKKIPLSQGEFALVDDEDYPELSKYRWYLHTGPDSKQKYAVRQVVRRRGPRLAGESGGKNCRNVFMHRQIMDFPEAKEIDHINRDGLDNRRANLRVCSRSQNQSNHSLQCNNTSGFHGVTWNNTHKLWFAYTKYNGKQRSGGWFHDKVEAAKARDRLVKKLHGTFAVLNFPKLRRVV